MTAWGPWLLKGMALGFAGAAINQLILMWGQRRIKILPKEKTTNTMVRCYLLRYFINIGTLVSAYFIADRAFFLIGTAVGLTLPKNIYLLKSLK